MKVSQSTGISSRNSRAAPPVRKKASAHNSASSKQSGAGRFKGKASKEQKPKCGAKRFKGSSGRGFERK